MTTAITVIPTETKEDNVNLTLSQDIFKELQAIEDEIARNAFGLFLERGAVDGCALDDWLRAELNMFEPVPFKIAESDDSFTVKAEVPGFAAKDLKVEADSNTLLIRGAAEESQKSKDKKTEREFSRTTSRKIFRSIALPAQMNAKDASAKFGNGILTISVPKLGLPGRPQRKRRDFAFGSFGGGQSSPSFFDAFFCSRTQVKSSLRRALPFQGVVQARRLAQTISRDAMRRTASSPR